MRLPVVPQISTKDGTSNRNARLTNCLKEVKKAGEKAVIRPGLVLDAQASGVGNGLVVFNNELVSVYGATLGAGLVVTEASVTKQDTTGKPFGNSIVSFGSGYVCVMQNTGGASGEYIYYTEDFVTFTEVWDNDVQLTVYLFGLPVVAGGTCYVSAEDEDTGDPYIVTFTSTLVANFSAGTFYGSIWTGTEFVGGYSSTQSTSSSNGTTWTPKSYGMTLFGQQFAYLNGVFVVSGHNGSTLYILSCTSSTPWAVVSSQAAVGGNYNTGVAGGENRFVMVGLNVAMYSTDGTTWVAATLPTDVMMYSVIYHTSLGKFIALADYYFYDSTMPLLTSDDGVTWEDFGITQSYVSTSGARKLAATTDGVVYVSTVCSDYVCSVPTPTLTVAEQVAGSTEFAPISAITGDHYDFAQSPI